MASMAIGKAGYQNTDAKIRIPLAGFMQAPTLPQQDVRRAHVLPPRSAPPDVSAPRSKIGGLGVCLLIRRFVLKGVGERRWARMRRFRGESLHKVDAKGRVSIPALFRRVIQACDPNWQEGLPPELVIVYGDARRPFLECYTVEAIEEVDRKIDQLPRGSVGRKTLERLFHGQSHPTSVDETGRLVLPAKLRQKIAVEGEAYFIAAGDTFQIWNPDSYSEDQAKTEAWLSDQPDDFDPLSFLDGGQEG